MESDSSPCLEIKRHPRYSENKSVCWKRLRLQDKNIRASATQEISHHLNKYCFLKVVYPFGHL